MVESFASGRHTSALPPSFRLSGTAFALACAGLLGGALLPLAARAQTAAAPSTVSATALPEVQVTASAEEAKNQGHTTTITAEDLQKQGAASMADVVRYQPLVSAPETASGTGNLWDGAGTPGYNVRGLEGNRVALEVDGIELPPAEIKPDGMSTSSFSTGRDTLETDLFQQVEIASGATAAGRAGSPNLGGRVSFTTKSPEDFLRDGKQSHLGYKFGYQSANKSRAHTLTGATQIGAVQALGIYVRRDGEQAKSEGDISPNPQDWDSNALLTKFVWGAHTGNRLGLSVEHFDRGTQYTNASEVTASMPQAPGRMSPTAAAASAWNTATLRRRSWPCSTASKAASITRVPKPKTSPSCPKSFPVPVPAMPATSIPTVNTTPGARVPMPASPLGHTLCTMACPTPRSTASVPGKKHAPTCQESSSPKPSRIAPVPPRTRG
jgi:outer membrane receptor protein involved in Fe transport